MLPNNTTPPKLAQRCAELFSAIINLSEAYLYEARLDDALCLLASDVVELLAGELPLAE